MNKIIVLSLLAVITHTPVAITHASPQSDCNANGFDDFLEHDRDGDSVIDSCDNCPTFSNIKQIDTDNDSFGNRCDVDFNNDGRIDKTDKSIFKKSVKSKHSHADLNSDGIIDKDDRKLFRALFSKPLGPGLVNNLNDLDKDGIVDTIDNCSKRNNPLQVDLDSDGIGDLCDICPTQPNADQLDSNFNGGGDACAPTLTFKLPNGVLVSPSKGVQPELQQIADPLTPDVVHPVVLASRVFMGGEITQLEALGVRHWNPFSPNAAFASVPIASLSSVADLPFIHSLSVYPIDIKAPANPVFEQFENGSWSEIIAAPILPEPRRDHATAYDTNRSELIVFGGLGMNSTLESNSWKWNGISWTQIGTGGSFRPNGRGASIVYDPVRDEVLLFGGCDLYPGIATDRTWRLDLDTNAWQILSPATTPPPRCDHAMSFDEQRGVIVMAGGRTSKISGSFVGLSDSWTWDGSNWTQQDDLPVNEAVPTSRMNYDGAMTYDPSTESILLFGGVAEADCSDPPPSVCTENLSNETLSWNGSRWDRLSFGSTPAARKGHTILSIPDLNGVLLFGGRNESDKLLFDTYFLQSGQWKLLSTTLTASLSDGIEEFSGAFNSATGRINLFGGGRVDVNVFDVTNDLFEFTTEPLTQVLFHDGITPGVATRIFARHGASIIAPSVLYEGKRFNFWTIAVSDTDLQAMARSDLILDIDPARKPDTRNFSAQQVTHTTQVQSSDDYCETGCDGSGILIQEFDDGWVAVDDDGMLPGSPGSHEALTGRVYIRDKNPLDPTGLSTIFGTSVPEVWSGCSGQIVSDNKFSDHATLVAGTMIATRTSAPSNEGMAPNAGIISYLKPNTLNEHLCKVIDAVAFGNNVRLQNNSWGVDASSDSATCDLEGFYDQDSVLVDQLAVRVDHQMTQIFAASNSQIATRSIEGGLCGLTDSLPEVYKGPSTGGACRTPPPGVSEPTSSEPSQIDRSERGIFNRFYTLGLGRGEIAKNTITVGAINSGLPSALDSVGRMTTFSGWGPTKDGRIKPDIVAPGAENNIGVPGSDPGIASTACDSISGDDECLSVSNGFAAGSGTSMSAPVVTGISALILQHQESVGISVGDTQLDADSLKAVLLHTAIDLPVHFDGEFMQLESCDDDDTDVECWPGVSSGTPIFRNTTGDGPDYINGWGMINAEAAADLVSMGNPRVELLPSSCTTAIVYDPFPFNSPLAIGGESSVLSAGCSEDRIWDWVGYINIPEGSSELKITITWLDDESAPGGGLVRDLDVIATRGDGRGSNFRQIGPNHYTWWLDPTCPYREAVKVNSNSFDGVTYSDHDNNVEQIVINGDDLISGQWKVVVQSMGGVVIDPTEFAIAISIN